MTTISIVDIFDVLNTVSISTLIIKGYFKTTLKGHIMAKLKNMIADIKRQIVRTELHLSTMEETMGAPYIGHRQPNPAYFSTESRVNELKEFLRQLKLLKKNRKIKKKEERRTKEMVNELNSINYQIENGEKKLSTMRKLLGAPYRGYCMPNPAYDSLAEKIEILKGDRKMIEAGEKPKEMTIRIVPGITH